MNDDERDAAIRRNTESIRTLEIGVATLVESVKSLKLTAQACTAVLTLVLAVIAITG